MEPTKFQKLLKSGTTIWPTYYEKSKDDGEALEKIQAALNLGLIAGECLPAITLHDKRGVRPDARTIDPSFITEFLWTAKWVDGGCRTITSDEKYFSAMAQTRCHLPDEIKIPWPAFMMLIPKGLIIDDEGNEYTLACFAEFNNIRVPDAKFETHRVAETCSFYQISSESGMLQSSAPISLAEMLCDPPSLSDKDDSDIEITSDRNEKQNNSHRRIRELVRRAVIGLLYTFQHTKNWRFHSSRFGRAGQVRQQKGPPAHRTILIGRPISVNVSDAVRSDARSGSRSAPSVQTLVRGHIKRQPCGPKQSDRKVIWIEPYWRGSKDAPILVRPYKIEEITPRP